MDVDRIVSECEKSLNGKQDKIRLALCNFLAQGHTLIEDMPGVGKTTLAKSLAGVFSLDFNRTQFTNDLLPADILGYEMYNPKQASFSFKKGPIFTDIFLADELNRAPARTQSALLQVMEERSIAINNYEFELSPFFHVIATQNPLGQIGTFDLPESQLDRFSMKISIGYVDEEESVRMLKKKSTHFLKPETEQTPWRVSREDITAAQQDIDKVSVDDAIYRYVYRLAHASRSDTSYGELSNRCAIDIIKCSKTWAWMGGRNYVLPEDVIELFPYIAGHRLSGAIEKNAQQERLLAQRLLESVNIRP